MPRLAKWPAVLRARAPCSSTSRRARRSTAEFGLRAVDPAHESLGAHHLGDHEAGLGRRAGAPAPLEAVEVRALPTTPQRRCVPAEAPLPAHAVVTVEPGVYLPGVRVKTSATDFYPIEQMQMMRFSGERFL